MPTITCTGDINPERIECVDHVVDLTVQFQVHNADETFVYTVEYEVVVNGQKVSTGQETVEPNDTVVSSHTVTLPAPADPRFAWFTCTGDHRVEINKTGEEISERRWRSVRTPVPTGRRR